MVDHLYDLVIVGGGPAGLAAANEAALNKARVCLVDENNKIGGQLYKQIHKFFGSEMQYAGKRGFQIAEEFLINAQKNGVELMLNTEVWGIFENLSIGVNFDKKTIKKVQAEKVILATGASEKGIVFPGWTLPGVMGAGGLQTFMNEHRVLPGKKVLMIGSGNVGLIVSYQLLQAGAEVVAVVEASPKIGGYYVHASKLQRLGVHVYTKHTVIKATGEKHVEKAVIAEIDDQWQALAGTEKYFDVDIICLSVGLNPLAELAWMAGCEFIYEPTLGGHVPIHDINQETTVNGIYVAGDISGIEEASTAIEEGRLAGIAATQALGIIPDSKADLLKAEILARLETLRLGKFGLKRMIGKQNILTRFGVGVRQSHVLLDFTDAIGVEKNDLGLDDFLDENDSFAEVKGLTTFPIIDCPEDIPCDPCEKACSRGVITIGKPITNLPRIDAALCNGCGKCVALCPGLAIFLVKLDYTQDNAIIGLPYELLPLPKIGQQVNAIDNEGKAICLGEIVKVEYKKAFNITNVVYVSVPKEYVLSIRGIFC